MIMDVPPQKYCSEALKVLPFQRALELSGGSQKTSHYENIDTINPVSPEAFVYIVEQNPNAIDIIKKVTRHGLEFPNISPVQCIGDIRCAKFRTTLLIRKRLDECIDKAQQTFRKVTLSLKAVVSLAQLPQFDEVTQHDSASLHARLERRSSVLLAISTSSR